LIDDAVYAKVILINTVFYLDQQNTLKEFFRKLTQARKVLEKLSADQRVDLLAWLRDVLVKKIRRALPDADDLDTIIDMFEKGEDEPMIYAIERMIDEVEKDKEEAVEKAVEKGKAEGKEEMVKNLLALGISAEIIQEASGLNSDEIERLRSGDDGRPFWR
jgi:predicted transposase/invertase (TIGR01784 family)